MKITLYARPRFSFEIDESTADLLIMLGEAHYSYECKGAAKAPSGFLYFWKCRLQSHDYYPETEDNQELPMEEREYDPCLIHASFKELDIVTKCCEIRRSIPSITDHQHKILDRFLAAVSMALKRSNELTPTWKEEIHGTTKN